jgi:hypothetical protein
VAHLDFEAKALIDEVEANGKKLPSNSFSYLADQSNRAARMLIYAKAGILWTLFVFVYASCTGHLKFKITEPEFVSLEPTGENPRSAAVTFNLISTILAIVRWH